MHQYTVVTRVGDSKSVPFSELASFITQSTGLNYCLSDLHLLCGMVTLLKPIGKDSSILAINQLPYDNVLTNSVHPCNAECCIVHQIQFLKLRPASLQELVHTTFINPTFSET